MERSVTLRTLYNSEDEDDIDDEEDDNEPVLVVDNTDYDIYIIVKCLFVCHEKSTLPPVSLL